MFLRILLSPVLDANRVHINPFHNPNKRLAKINPRPSNPESLQEEKKESDAETTAAPTQRGGSVASSTRSKDSPTPARIQTKKSILTELEQRRQQGKIQRVPTYQEPDDATGRPIVGEAASLKESAPPKVIAPVASKECVPTPPLVKSLPLPPTGSTRSVPSSPPRIPPKDFMAEITVAISKHKSKESGVTSVTTTTDSTAAPDAATVPSEGPGAPLVVSAAASKESVDKDDENAAKSVAVEKGSPEEESNPVGVATESDELLVTSVETTEKVRSTSENTPEETLSIATTTTVEETKKDTVEDSTEVTTDDDIAVTTEEKNGLIVTSSASEVEVSAGSGFSFEKFCFGLNLGTADSN